MYGRNWVALSLIWVSALMVVVIIWVARTHSALTCASNCLVHKCPAHQVSPSFSGRHGGTTNVVPPILSCSALSPLLVSPAVKPLGGAVSHLSRGQTLSHACSPPLGGLKTWREALLFYFVIYIFFFTQISKQYLNEPLSTLPAGSSSVGSGVSLGR